MPSRNVLGDSMQMCLCCISADVEPCGELQVKSAWLGRLQFGKNGKNK